MRVTPLLEAAELDLGDGSRANGWRFLRPPVSWNSVPVGSFLRPSGLMWTERSGWFDCGRDDAAEYLRQHHVSQYPEYLRLLSAITVEPTNNAAQASGLMTAIYFVARNIPELDMERGDVLLLMRPRSEALITAPNMRALTWQGYEALHTIRDRNATFIDISPWHASKWDNVHDFLRNRRGWGRRDLNAGKWASRLYVCRVVDTDAQDAITALLRDVGAQACGD